MIFNFDIEPVTLENIFKRISDIEIYEFYLKENITTVKKYHSPFRRDKNPSLSFMLTDKNILIWRDWGDPIQLKSETVISFVMKLFSCSFKDALYRINQDIGLGLDGGQIDHVEINGFKKEKVQQIYKKEYSNIIVRRRNFNKLDIEFWNKYHISLKTLSYFNVFPVSGVWIVRHKNLKTYSINKKYIYAYKFIVDNQIKYKIYSPKETIFKWITNCSINIVQGFNNLQFKSNLLIITKSLKDVMVLYEMGYESISPQSETSFMSDDKITFLKNKFKKIVLLYDNDKTGIFQGIKISKQYNLKNIMIPKSEYKTKDISDTVKIYSFDNAKKLIENLLI